MSDKAGKKNENAFKNAADTAQTSANTAITTAAAPDPLEQRQRDQALAFNKWETGESGPIDVRDMPGGGVDLALFNDAKTVHDANRIGRGVGSMSGTANPNFVAALDKENEMARNEAASGALEQNVNNKIASNNALMSGLAQQGDQRNEYIAGLQSSNNQNAQNRNLTYMMRPKQPNFFRQLANSFMGGAGAAAAAG